MSLTDSLIVVLAAALVGGLYLLLWSPQEAGAELSVWVSGEERLRLPLDLDRRLEIEGALGVSVVEIRNGRARVAASPGPRQICVHAGWLEQAGESAVCLPNEVVIRIEAANARYDAMSF